MSTITDIQGTFELNNGVQMPYLGLGVYQAEEGGEVERAVQWALEAGYRHIDTARAYGNEAGVGKALRESGVDREEVFVTSKVWNSDQGYESTLKAFDSTMDDLGLDYLDLYLVHWPVEGKYKDTWRALEHLYDTGRVRAIGVSNFLQHHLEDLLADAEVIPAVDQLEFHPYLVQQPLQDYCQAKKIQYEAWSPLMQGEIFKLPEMEAMADSYGKSIAQVVLRWDLQKGVVTIPKSSKKERIRANADLFDFELSEEDVAKLDAMDRGHRFGPDPDNFDF
ncbi:MULTISPECIES: aldo/keto reductase [Robiginitalea]|uniref:Oxidoreductase, aldo/keto reductase family protein n=1 Tax=Robiginitalea biformata (strain ATCC BAA-864 / DSM 15991 / KCTC 12146 / HTCC2501) TaxID=313596 RepID=A4CHX1_ROBBH|nr:MULTISPECIES: aldo/keto reductase [Robiginitalea]EAR16529.1 oxidoreductase, aldo/keto reductase family protein [Robiginitalea biformata HTCC2501]MDC6353235.1 aldo/keto reductase [Robiginitalea sp. PM2]MDC6373599.1 aldo/keto reductase [Robiginitalea sp. SP8]